jgi:hypothetical protein
MCRILFPPSYHLVSLGPSISSASFRVEQLLRSEAEVHCPLPEPSPFLISVPLGLIKSLVPLSSGVTRSRRKAIKKKGIFCRAEGRAMHFRDISFPSRDEVDVPKSI